MSYKIENGIPIPKRKCGIHDSTSAALLASFEDMKVGDSIVFDGLRSHAYGVAKYYGYKITTRKSNGDGFRVWLIGKVKK